MNLVHAMNVVATYSGLAKFGNVLIVTIQKKIKKITPHYRIYSSGEEPLLFMIIFLHRP